MPHGANMDISKLIPYIKQASALVVKPDEVAAQLQKQEQTKLEDKERETVDNEVIEQDERPTDENSNDEGKMMADSFVELEIEDAIDKAKEEKLLSSDVGHNMAKIGTCYDALSTRFANPNRFSYWDILKFVTK